MFQMFGKRGTFIVYLCLMAAGRPKIYDDPEELFNAVESYFIDIQKPTITGLALHLGFADKTTLYEYRDRQEFSYPIKKAITLIEKYHEEGLTENNVAGRIFALKNMGWKDKTETEHSGQMNFTWNETLTYDSEQETDESL